MIRSLVSLLVLSASAGVVLAQETPAPEAEPVIEEEAPREPNPRVSEVDQLSSRPGTVLVLRGLDKVTARTQDFEVRIGETETFGSLEVTARYCRRRPPEETPEIFAFLQVADRRTDGFGSEDESENIFSGWMFGSNPALNPLEHPVYDVWVIDCRA